MICRISDDWLRNAYHEQKVATVVAQLQENGYNVYKIEKVASAGFMWGNDITDIHYSNLTPP